MSHRVHMFTALRRILSRAGSVVAAVLLWLSDAGPALACLIAVGMAVFGSAVAALWLLAWAATFALVGIHSEMSRARTDRHSARNVLTLPQYTNLMGDPLTGEVEITTRYRTGPGEHFTKEHIRGGTR